MWFCSGRSKKRCEQAARRKLKVVRGLEFFTLWIWINVLNGSKSAVSKSSRLNALFLQQRNKKRVRPLSKLRTERVCPPFFLVVGAFAFQRFGFWEKQGRHNILLQLVSCVFSEFGISNRHLFYNCACNHHHHPPSPFQTQLVRLGVHQASLVIETSDKAVEAECREAHQSPLLPLRWLSQSRCVVSVLGSLLKYLDPTGGDLHERLAQR